MKIFPAAFPASSPSESPIDLTTKDQYPLSNVRDEVDHQALFSPSSKPDSDMTRTQARVSVPIPIEDSEYDAPHSPRDPWSFSNVDNTNLTQSTDMDTESLPGTESDDESVGFSPVVSVLMHEDEDSDDMSEQDFEEDECMDYQELDTLASIDLFLDNCEDPLDESELEDQEDQEDPEDADQIWGFSQVGTRVTVPSLPSFAKEAQATPVAAPAPEQPQPVNRGTGTPQMDYLLNPFPVAVLPRNLVVHPRLPSISETIPQQPLFSRPYQEGLSAAEMLGLKTGKHEFFAAREANKAESLSMASSSQLSQPRFHTPLPVPQSPSLSSPDSRRPPRKHALEETLRPVSFSKRKKETHNDTSEGLQLVDSDLAKSGAEFLNTPPLEPEVPSSTEEPALDASSAYEYALSKKDNDGAADGAADGAVDSAEAVVTDAPAAVVDAMDDVDGGLDANTADKREEEPLELTQGGNENTGEKAVPSSDIAEEPAHTVEPAEPKLPEASHDLPETPRSSKRKAEDISQLTPEEEKHAEVVSRGERSRYARLRFRRRMNNMARPAVSAPAAAPPSKRLRRVAEVVGYAALGGVAVMSALIATAPTL